MGFYPVRKWVWHKGPYEQKDCNNAIMFNAKEYYLEMSFDDAAEKMMTVMIDEDDHTATRNDISEFLDFTFGDNYVFELDWVDKVFRLTSDDEDGMLFFKLVDDY